MILNDAKVKSELVAVTSRSFSKNPILRQRLQDHFAYVKFNEEGIKLTDETLIHFLSGATRAIIGLEKIDDNLLKNLPELKVICKVGTGTDKIDFDAIERRKIIFTATPGVNKRSVSELVLGLIFTLQRRLPTIQSMVKQGTWQQPAGRLLSNKTVGIIGFGAVGQDLSTLLTVFECNCLIYDVKIHEHLMPHVSQVDLKTLLRESDIVSLHIPLTPTNYHFLGMNELLLMKHGAILINTARGGLIDEDALYTVLVNGGLSAAALDVFEEEPKIPEKLLALANFFATSHIGGSTEEAIHAMGMLAIEKLVNINS